MTKNRHIEHYYWHIFIWTAVLLFVINGAISYGGFRSIAASQTSLTYTVGVMQTFERLENLTYNLQIEELIMDERFSGERMEKAEKLIDSADIKLNELLNMRSQIEGQTERINRLYETLKDKIDKIKARRQGHSIDAMNFHSRYFVQAVNDILNEIQSAEEDFLNQEFKNIAIKTKKIKWTLFSSTITGMVLAISLALWMRRVRQGEIRQQRAVEELNSYLELKVAQRTRALEHYAGELKRSNRELEEFAFVASHDLQEPLRKIQAFSTRLKNKYANVLDARGLDYLQRMVSAAERMSTLIDNLLTFSRVTSKPGAFEKVNLNGILDATLEDLDQLIEDTGASIQRDCLPEIEADATQLRQLFQNLVSNSLKFNDAGTRPQIQIHCEQLIASSDDSYPRRNWFKITIIDNGIGFDPEFSEKIFSPFQRLVTRHQYQGTGIGLAVCRRIVERHEGQISATSSPGKGTTICILLPAYQISERISRENKSNVD